MTTGFVLLMFVDSEKDQTSTCEIIVSSHVSSKLAQKRSLKGIRQN